MTGSSTILQTLLPGKSGDAVQRSASPRKNEQSFAAVFEKKIQVRQDKAALPAAASDVADRRQAVNERRQEERSVEKTQKSEKPVAKNPAKQKMKELMKKVDDTLDAMKNPDISTTELKELAKTLKDTLTEIKDLVAAMDSGSASTEKPGADNPEITKMIESMGMVQTAGSDTPVVTDEAEGEGERTKTGRSEGIPKTEHWNNRQAPEIKGNPILKDLEKVIEAQTDIIESDPELKAVLESVLNEIKTIQNSEVTRPDKQFNEKLENLINKLNGTVEKAVETKTAEVEAEIDIAVDAPTVEGSIAKPVASGAADDGAESQQSPTDDSKQADTAQAKQPYNAEIPAESKDEGDSAETKTSTGKLVAAVEKTDTTAPKPVTQGTSQPVQMPQAFQDALDAVKETAQAKTQFQSRIMEQVIETVKTNFKGDDGKSEMIMKLKPESLGNVALKVSIDKGIVLAQFQVESQAVKQALEANLQDLRSALQDKGYNVFTLDVSVRKDNQQQQNSNNGKGYNNRTARVEGSLDRIEKSLMSLESSHRESTIDYLG